MKRESVGRAEKTVWLIAAVSILSVSVGMGVAASVLTTQVVQQTGVYQGQFEGVPNYSNPTLNVSLSPGSCQTTSTESSGTLTPLVLSYSGATGTCALADFAELWGLTFTAPASFAGQTNHLTVYSEISGTLYTTVGKVTVPSGATGSMSLSVYVDFGSGVAPNLTLLELVVGP